VSVFLLCSIVEDFRSKPSDSITFKYLSLILLIMKLDEDLVKHVAKVARLELTKNEIKEFLPQLKEVLDAFSEISKLKTTEEPSFQPVEIKDVLRDDKVVGSLSQEQALMNTKHKKNGYFKGPRAI